MARRPSYKRSLTREEEDTFRFNEGDYIIERHESLERLLILVNERMMVDGYTPLGGVSYSQNTFVQALVRSKDSNRINNLTDILGEDH